MHILYFPLHGSKQIRLSLTINPLLQEIHFQPKIMPKLLMFIRSEEYQVHSIEKCARMSFRSIFET